MKQGLKKRRKVIIYHLFKVKKITPLHINLINILEKGE